MRSKLPTIRIKDAWLLRKNASVYLNELWGNGESLLSNEKYLTIVKNYQKAWEPHEHKILKSMCDIIDLQFRQNIIDVYIAPWFSAFSDPLVIGVIYDPDLFVDILIHELTHRLLTDNQSILYNTRLLKEWHKLFGDHNFGTLVHIPVHAVNKAIYLDILKQPKRLKIDIERAKTFKTKDYIHAWDYVNEHGYEEIIDKLKKSYSNLKQQQVSQ